MDGELILIFGFVLTILVTVLTFGTIAGQRSREHKLRRLEIEARIEEAKAQQALNQRQEAVDIEERLRVLERIVTDPGADLSRQIEDLRKDSLARKEAAS
ncbi:hypothetical protein [Aurantiacibacter hainanensis]|uniref:hypothetical protein n=1 Tax=Aurantiacibacter hainanensis TaxID=3076114 RepID=UPI0030C68D2A